MTIGMKKREMTLSHKISRDWKMNKYKYLLILPVLVYLALFCYKPMYGLIIAFNNYKPTRGITGSDYVGLMWFDNFFNNIYFWRLLSNTFTISALSIVFGFPAPIILALLLNECHTSWYRRMVQTVSYMPHFLSWVVIYGITYLLCSESSGYINRVLRYFDSPTVSILTSNSAFRPMLYITHIWKGTGFSSIIYLATMTSIDPTLYEAAQVDGAGRLQRIWHITLPGIRSTFVMLCIISAGSIMNAGFDQVYVFYNELVYETGDIIDTYVYRAGLLEMNYSLSTAVGLMKSAISIVLILTSNRLAYKLANYRIF